MAEITFRLTIYRLPAVAARPMKYFPGEKRVLFNPANLGEELYAWVTSVKIWDSIEDDDLRRELYEWITGFDGTGREGRESVLDLLPFLEKLQSVIEPDKWILANSTRLVGGNEDFDLELQIRPLLTFSHHLQWIYETFGNTPDLMVVYR